MSVGFYKSGVIYCPGTDCNKNMCTNSLSHSGESSTAYDIGDYNLTESLVEGQKYTISAKVNTSSDKKSVLFYLSGGSMGLGTWQPRNDDGIYVSTFTAQTKHASNTSGAGHGFIRVYVSNNEGIQGSTTRTGTANVDWIKCEKGSIATPWCSNEADEEWINANCGFNEYGDLTSVYAEHVQANEFVEY